MSLVVTKVCQGADLVPPWTCTFAVVRDQVLSSWLVIFRPATRSCRLWEFLNSYPSEELTSLGCWDQKFYAVFASTSTSTTQHQAASPPTASRILVEVNINKMKTSTYVTSPKPIGWIGQTQSLRLSYPRVLGIHGYLCYRVWFDVCL